MRLRRRWTILCLTILGTLTANPGVSHSQFLHRNAGELTNLSQDIIVGQVLEVSDGIGAENLPYTEVTLEISETLKGTLSATYTFRQFGLIKPREMSNGLVYSVVTPPGWPRFKKGETVLLFLYQEAAVTGLRTTAGVSQGKFVIAGGRMANEANNEGLFFDLSVSDHQLTVAERMMLRQKDGPLDAEIFIPFIRKAIEQDWFAGAN